MLETQQEGFQVAPTQQHLLHWAKAESHGFQATLHQHLQGPLDLDRLKDAVAHLTNRMETLRTYLHTFDGMDVPLLVAGETSQLTLNIHEGGQDPHQMVEALQARPIDLKQSWCNLTVIPCGANEYRFFWQASTLFLDRLGLYYLAQELGASYAALEEGTPLDQEPLAYIDLAQWMNDLLSNEDTREARKYWAVQNKGDFWGQHLQCADHRDQVDYQRQTVPLWVENETVASWENLAQDLGTTLEKLLAAAWMTVLSRLTGAPEISLGIAMDGRKYDELRDAVGIFARNVPITTSLDKTATMTDLLSQLAEPLRLAYEWQEFYQWQSDAQQTGAFPFQFSYHTELPAGNFGPLTILSQEARDCIEPEVLALRCLRSESHLTFQLDFNKHVLNSDQVSAIAAHLHTFMQALQAEPQASLEQVRGLSEEATTHLATTLAEQRDIPAQLKHRPEIDHAYVFDGQWQLCPPCTLGRIFLGSSQPWELPEGQTIEGAPEMVPNPYKPGSYLFDGGDFGYLTPEGKVISTGNLAEKDGPASPGKGLSHVVELLSADSQVLEASVTRNSHGQLIAQIATVENAAVDPSAVLTSLAQQLPRFLLPKDILISDHLTSATTHKNALRTEGDYPKLHHPNNMVELKVLGMWEQILGTSPLGVTQAFRDVGGDSLMAVRLMHLVNNTFESQLPMTTPFEAPTVRAMSALLATGADSQRQALLPLNTESEARPLFCVHGGGGTPFNFTQLATLLKDQCPTYGLNPRGLNAGEEPVDAIPLIAQEYVEAIQGVQPQGPYRILGWSFGGLVAYEMALILEAKGEKIESLILLDVPAPTIAARHQRELNQDEAELIGLLYEGAVGEQLDVAHIRSLETLDQRLDYALNTGKEQGLLPPDTSTDLLAQILSVHRAHDHAVAHYEQTKPLQCALHLFCPTQDPHAPINENGWHTIAPSVFTHPLPGNHQGMLEMPAVKVMEDKLRSLMSEVCAS